MASAGQNFNSVQLKKMDANVAIAITAYAQFPEVSNLIDKLSATRAVKNQEIPWAEIKNVESQLNLAKQNKIHPKELLSYEDSELVQEYLWEGKLKGNKDFLDLNMNSSTASMSGFSKAGVSLIRSNGYSAIDALLSVVKRHSRKITRERMSDQFLQKLDILLADKLKDDLRLPVSSSNTDNSRYPASLDLAERLGGTNAALAIATAGKKKPEVLREFKGMLGAMIALNEPETYGMIVNAWVIHGDVDGLETIGEAIEPQFITRLQVRLKKLNPGDKQQRRVIHFLTSALGKTGTAKSIPLLESLAESKLVGFQKASAMAIKMIHERSDHK